ncbi:hypothetical protein [Streptomyces sp. 6N223]|uniref:hypothetical protein n=1 Tax=Streptomyces sp. 6N223 TaxID=3457412 RepID=UPI003FD033E3
MAIPEAEARRITIKGSICSIPGFVVSALLTVNFGGTLLSWAESWPGEHTGFMVTLGAVSALSLQLLSLGLLIYAAPERTPPSLRALARVCVPLAMVGLLAFILTIMSFVMTIPGRREQPTSCDVDAFDCVIRAYHSGAGNAGFYSHVLVLAVGAALLAWFSGTLMTSSKRRKGITWPSRRPSSGA